MIENVKILLIEDRNEYYEKLKGCENLTEASILHWGPDETNKHGDKNMIVERIKNKLNEDYFENENYQDCFWVVLLDYQLYEQRERFENINSAYREGVIKTILNNNKVYLMVYSAWNPEGCASFREKIYELISSGEAKFYFYYRYLPLSMVDNLENYRVVFQRYINKELNTIGEGKADDEKWIHHQE